LGIEMPEIDDHHLLENFGRTQSETAFATLVDRYVNLVYSTALRSTGNPHHAEEITQAVFVILARKACQLSPRVVLSGWLYQTVRLTAANFLKSEFRRQRREQEATMQSESNEPSNAAWQEIAPLLDEAMGQLNPADRDAVVLRFFQNKTAAEMAVQLHLSEAAAHKRTGRAVEKLRQFFLKRGVSSTAALITGTIATQSVHAAPSALTGAAIAAALTQGASVSASTLTLIKGALKLMAWTKAKTALITGVIVLLAAGTTTIAVKQLASPPASYLRIEGKGTIELMPGDKPRLVETADLVLLTDGIRYRITVVSQGHTGLTNDAYDCTVDCGCDGRDFFAFMDRKLVPLPPAQPGALAGIANPGRFPTEAEIPKAPIQAAWLAYCSSDFFNLPTNRTGSEFNHSISSILWPDFITNLPTFWPDSTLPKSITGWSRNWIIQGRKSSQDPMQASELKQYPDGFKVWQFTVDDPVTLQGKQFPRKAVFETFYPQPSKTPLKGNETLLVNRATFTADSITVVKGRLEPMPPVKVPDLPVLDWRFKDVSWNYLIISHATPSGWPTRGSQAYQKAADEAARQAREGKEFIALERAKEPKLIPPP
jgi:RNA polymerase sigma factor (sigma-70 family)